MMLSEDKISHISHILLGSLIERNLVALIGEEGAVRREIKLAIITDLKVGEVIDEVVRRKLQSFSRKIIEGSPEWEVLYRKFFREEEIKKGRASG